MSLSKITTNFVLNREIDLYFIESEEGEMLCIDIGLDLSEPSLVYTVYTVNRDESFSYSSLLDNRYKEIKEELPAFIKDEMRKAVTC